MRACTAMHRHGHTHVRKWQLFLSAIPTEMGIYFFLSYQIHNSIGNIGLVCLRQIEIGIDRQLTALHDEYCETMRSSIKLCALTTNP